jgi:hypothetical protein
MGLTDLPNELLTVIFEMAGDLRNVVLTHKVFHPAVARIEIRGVRKIFKDLREIATANHDLNLPAADIKIQRAMEMIKGDGITLENCSFRPTIRPEQRQACRAAVLIKRAKHLMSALLICFYIPGRWLPVEDLSHLCSELKNVLDVCVKAKDWRLASEVLGPLRMLPGFKAVDGSLSASVMAWIKEHMCDLSWEELAGVSDVVRLLDTDSDMTFLADHIRSDFIRSDVMSPQPLLLLQNVSPPAYSDGIMTRFANTLRKSHEDEDWCKVEKLLKLLARLPDVMRHPDVIKLVKEISLSFGRFLNSTNADSAASNLSFSEHILVEELDPTTIISIVRCVEKRMDSRDSLESDNHRVLQNLPSKSTLTDADFIPIRKLLREQLLASVKKLRNCYELQSKLNMLYGLPPYLKILDDALISDPLFTQSLERLPDQSRIRTVLSYYMPVTLSEGPEQLDQIRLHRQHLIRCIRDRHYQDAVTSLELIRDRLFHPEFVKTKFLDIVQKLRQRSVLTREIIDGFTLRREPWQPRVRHLIQE